MTVAPERNPQSEVTPLELVVEGITAPEIKQRTGAFVAGNNAALIALAGAPTNLLKGELLSMWLKYGVAPGGELAGIDGVVRGIISPLDPTRIAGVGKRSLLSVYRLR